MHDLSPQPLVVFESPFTISSSDLWDPTQPQVRNVVLYRNKAQGRMSFVKFSDRKILRMMNQGRILVTPFHRRSLRPTGVRVHLGNEIIIFKKNQLIDIKKGESPAFKRVKIDKKPYRLKPKEFILAATREKIWTDSDVLAILDGRSTVARLGLSIHNTAFVLDGCHVEPIAIVLEITNHSPVHYLLHEGDSIGMVLFEKLDGNVSGKTHNKRYAHQTTVLPPNNRKLKNSSK